eukprot:4742552-Heterocapsa_arctica.AAC.1
MENWAPWSQMLEHIRDDTVWGGTTDADFWNIIMGTRHRDMGHNSFMVKRWPDRNMTCIKATPWGGIKRKIQSDAKDEGPSDSHSGGGSHYRQADQGLNMDPNDQNFHQNPQALSGQGASEG